MQIRQSSCLPSTVCERCHEFVNMWCSFRKMCLNSQVYLECTYGQEERPKELVNASETEYMEYLYDWLQVERNSDAENQYETTEEYVQFDSYDQEQECPTKAEYDYSVEEELAIEDDERSIDVIEMYELDEEEKEDTNSNQTTDHTLENVIHSEEDYVDNEVYFSSTLSPEAAPSTAVKRGPGRPRKPGRKIRSKNDLLPKKFVCNLCGNVYPKKAAYTTHMMSHTDYKPHQCELCSKSFRQMGELRAHMRRHTGVRPYKCVYCERHFYDRSEKARHERVHTNTRPYECDECGKSFTHTATLKNHRLVHTGQKNFNCEICSKSFTLLHQLKAHQQTLTHKNKEEQIL
ncbi:CG14710, partial [Drosophila busckii]